jgi:hypothetical protein
LQRPSNSPDTQAHQLSSLTVGDARRGDVYRLIAEQITKERSILLSNY